MRNDCKTLDLTRRDNHILLGMFDAAEAANAMNTEVAPEQMGVFEAFQIDLEDLRRAILTDCDDKAFCAGGDPKARRGVRTPS
jgi:enoyl-CoA hydratase/carnithine racemase